MSPFRYVIGLAVLGGAAACTDEPSAVGPPLASSVALTSVDEAAQAALGRLIFFDQRLSLNQNQSCASCHDPTVGWTGPRSDVNAAGAVIEGSVAGRFGNRKPPSAAYATPAPMFHYAVELRDALFVGGNFWDGRATGERLGNPAADQALGPFLNPLEQALGSPADVVGRVCAGPYGAQFIAVWGAALCDPGNVTEAYNAVGRSIAAFEASSESNAFTSKFDYYRMGLARLTQEERQGLQLFRGKGKCSACHTLDGDALFTDFTYDNIGLPRNPENPFYGMPAEFNPAGAAWVDPGLGGFLATRSEWQAMAEENLGKQKVPTLRNVDLRPWPEFVKAYGHNGYFQSLASIVTFLQHAGRAPHVPGSLHRGAGARGRLLAGTRGRGEREP